MARGLSNTFAGITPGDVPLFVVAQLLGAVCALFVSSALTGPHSGIADADKRQRIPE